MSKLKEAPINSHPGKVAIEVARSERRVLTQNVLKGVGGRGGETSFLTIAA
jgi:hypothetical protein